MRGERKLPTRGDTFEQQTIGIENFSKIDLNMSLCQINKFIKMKNVSTA